MATTADQRGRSSQGHVQRGEALRALSDALYADPAFRDDVAVTWRDLYRVVSRVGGIPLKSLADAIDGLDVEPDAFVTWRGLLYALGAAERPYQSGAKP